MAFLNEADAERTARINQTSSVNGHGDQQKQPKKNQVSKRQGIAITFICNYPLLFCIFFLALQMLETPKRRRLSLPRRPEAPTGRRRQRRLQETTPPSQRRACRWSTTLQQETLRWKLPAVAAWSLFPSAHYPNRRGARVKSVSPTGTATRLFF